MVEECGASQVLSASVVFKCFQCLRMFASASDLNRHIDSTHYEESHDCEYCEAKFSRKDNYMRHVKKNHTDLHMKYACKVCETNFSRKTDLKRHMVSTSNEDGSYKFVCGQCNERFCTGTMLRAHCEFKHSETQGKRRCYRCLMNFGTQLALEAHDKQVHFQEVYECESCTKTFARKDNLLRHQTNHKAKTNLTCELCNTDFLWKTAMQRHQHDIYNKDGLPKHLCDHCSEQFCTSKILRAHINSLHRQFSCERCGKTFSGQSPLDYHVKNGTSVTCSQCKQPFCNERSLKNHIKTDHNL